MYRLRNVAAMAVLGSLVPVVLAQLKMFPDCINGPAILTRNQVCDPSVAPADRAAAIVGAMQINEKLQILVDQSPGVPRLGLPPYEWWSEALHGVASSPGVNFTNSGDFSSATSFPAPNLLGAIFDDSMIESIATVISTEARAFSNVGRAGLDFFTPNINPYRDPRWGRGSETPGEDPLHIMRYVQNLLVGLEGGLNPPSKKLVATCKHFAAYDLEDWDGNLRYGYNAIVSIQDLAEFYLPPFQQCARDNRVGSFMCSYNALNGIPTCANTYLLEDILRDHWSWTNQNQYVTSDCNAVSNIWTNHKYVTSNASASGVAFSAGTDQACQAGNYVDNTGAYDDGYLSEVTIDTALRRQFEALVRLGYFDSAASNQYRSIQWSDVNTPTSESLARNAAVDGIVMFKNDGTLPLTFTKNMSVAAIGFWANATADMLGGYSGIPPFYHNPVYAAKALGLTVNYADGPVAENTTTGNWTDAAMAAAEASDVIMYFGGTDLSIAAEAMDRYQISWAPSQLALIESICALGKPCVVVQLGDQVDDTPLLNNANISAILWAGYPGQDGGSAVFDIATGAAAPAGRLPVTQYPASYVNVSMTDMSLRPSSTNPGRTYKWFGSPVVPFGFGMHYTNFSGRLGPVGLATYDTSTLVANCNATYLDLCFFPSVSVSVTNTGKVQSDYVALVFISSTAGPAPHPIKELATYTRFHGIAPGQTMNASLPLKLGDIARRDLDGNLVLYPGTYNMTLDVDAMSSLSFTLTGNASQLEAWPQPPAPTNGTNGTVDYTVTPQS